MVEMGFAYSKCKVMHNDCVGFRPSVYLGEFGETEKFLGGRIPAGFPLWNAVFLHIHKP